MIKVNHVYFFIIFSLSYFSTIMSGHGEKSSNKENYSSFFSDDVHYLFRSKSRPIHAYDLHPTTKETREELKEEFIFLLSKKYLTEEEELKCQQLKDYLEEIKNY